MLAVNRTRPGLAVPLSARGPRKPWRLARAKASCIQLAKQGPCEFTFLRRRVPNKRWQRPEHLPPRLWTGPDRRSQRLPTKSIAAAETNPFCCCTCVLPILQTFNRTFSAELPEFSDGSIENRFAGKIGRQMYVGEKLKVGNTTSLFLNV